MAENITREELAAMDTMVIVEQRIANGHWPWALVRRPGMPADEAWGVLDLYLAIDGEDVEEHDHVRPGAKINVDWCGASDVDEWYSESEARAEYERLVGHT